MERESLYKVFGTVKGDQIYALIIGQVNAESFQSVRDWSRQCYNEPRYQEKVMRALNELLGGFGVESIEGEYVDSFYRNSIATYVNMGDSYDTTILYDTRSHEYILISYGDFIESEGL